MFEFIAAVKASLTECLSTLSHSKAGTRVSLFIQEKMNNAQN